MINKNHVITGTGTNMYELPESVMPGSVTIGVPGYTITEVPSQDGKTYVIFKPKLNTGENISVSYQVKAEDNPLKKIEKNAFKETISNSALIEILRILNEVIEAQNNLKSLLKEKVSYSELDAAVSPLSREVELMQQLLKAKNRK